MMRPREYAGTSWNDPFWHVVRMVVDETRGRVRSEPEIVTTLRRVRTQAAAGLLAYLDARPGMVGHVADYLAFRAYAGDELWERTRTEEQALEDLRYLSDDVVKRYGTRSADHHQSSKVLVATVEVLTRDGCLQRGILSDVDPQKRAAVISGEHIWVSPRRLDGALPSLLNPVGLWEIKEYWGGTAAGRPGGSKMSDAIYECQLVGQELRAFEDIYGPRMKHYAILDGRHQWSARRADLRRAVDLLCSGLLDELVVGSEVMTDWPRIVQELCDLVQERA